MRVEPVETERRETRFSNILDDGLDHERLTYWYAGRDFRLADASGEVLDSIIA